MKLGLLAAALLAVLWVRPCAARTETPVAAPAPPAAHPEPVSTDIQLPKPLDDSLSTELSEIMASFVRTTEPGWPIVDHPLEYRRCVAVLARLFTVAGDTILDDVRAQNFFIDRSLPNLRYPTSPRGQFPRVVSFSNPRRGEEWVSFLVLRSRAGGILFQRLGEDGPCCSRATGVQVWEEAGADRLIATMVRQDSTGAREWIQFYTRDGDRYVVTRTVGPEAFGGRYTVTLLNKVAQTPRLNIIHLETSHLFANFPAEQIVKLRGFYGVRGDSIELIRDQFGDSYFGATTWIMECLARGRADWGKLWTENEGVLRRLGDLPWNRARSGWIMEKYSTLHDTLTCSHPAVGRITLYSVRANGMDRVNDFKLEPLRPIPGTTVPKKSGSRPGSRKGRRR